MSSFHQTELPSKVNMEAVELLEQRFREEMTRLRQDLRGFHVRVIKLEKELRSSRQRNVKLKRLLTAEREQRKRNEKKLNIFIRDLNETTEEVQAKCEDLVERMVEMERTGDLRAGEFTLNTNFDNEAQSMMNDFNRTSQKVDAEVQAVAVNDHDQAHGNEEEVVAPETPVEGQNPLMFMRLSDSLASSPRMSEFSDNEPATFSSMSPLTSPPPPLQYGMFDDIREGTSTPPPPPVTLQTPMTPPPPPVTLQPPMTPPPQIIKAELPHAEDSDSGIDETTKRTPKRKQDPRWNLDHDVDPQNPTSLTCICGTALPSKKGLTEHIRYYTEKWKFVCNICNKPWPRLNILRKHQARVHKIVFDEGVNGKPIGCRKCSRKFHSRGELIRHRKLCKQRSPTPEVALPSGGIGNSSVANMNNDNSTHWDLISISSQDRRALPCPSASPSLSGIDYDMELDLELSPAITDDVNEEVREMVQHEIMKFISNPGRNEEGRSTIGGGGESPGGTFGVTN